MQKYRALLMGGICLGLVSIQAGTGIFAADEAPAEAPAAAETAAAAAEAAPPAAEAAPPMTPPGVTWYSGDTTPATQPAFTAEATMNPDYAAAAPVEAPAAAEAAPTETPAAAEAPAAEAPAAAAVEEAAPPMTPPGVTWYSGDTTPASPPAFAAEATMNPDYSPDAAAAAPIEAPAAEAPAAVAAEVPKTEDPVLPMTPSGITEYFGDTSARETMPFRAEATVYPSAPEPAPAVQAAVEACRDALNAEAQAGKINFATSAWDVLPDSFKTLDKIAKVAKDCSSNFVIEVGGHTDNTGKPASNKTISELRAKSVVTYLEKAGVDAAKLKAVGFGQDNPIGDNATVSGRRENRRIAFTVTGG